MFQISANNDSGPTERPSDRTRPEFDRLADTCRQKRLEGKIKQVSTINRPFAILEEDTYKDSASKGK